jgi:hypothetical protein
VRKGRNDSGKKEKQKGQKGRGPPFSFWSLRRDGGDPML